MNEIEDLRSKLKGLYKVTDPLQKSRIKKAKKSFRDMVSLYFNHHVKLPETSKFRNFFYDNSSKLIKENRNMLFKAYRGAAKTTLISRLFVLYEMAVLGKKRNAVIVSATINLSKKTLEFIKTELEENTKFIEDFNIDKGSKWTEDEIVFYADKKALFIRRKGKDT